VRRRRRRAYDDYDDEPDFEAAREKVSSPGLCLEFVGWGGAVLFLALAILCFVVGAEQQDRIQQNQNQNQNWNQKRNQNQNWNNPNQQGANQNDGIGLMIVGGCVGVFGLPVSIIMAIGGRKMRNLTSYNWAMTASILGIASIVLFGLCSVLHIGAGIWALTALTDRNVQECFKLGRRGRRREANPFEDAQEDGD
jgi:hypothetical protein